MELGRRDCDGPAPQGVRCRNLGHGKRGLGGADVEDGDAVSQHRYAEGRNGRVFGENKAKRTITGGRDSNTQVYGVTMVGSSPIVMR